MPWIFYFACGVEGSIEKWGLTSKNVSLNELTIYYDDYKYEIWQTLFRKMAAMNTFFIRHSMLIDEFINKISTCVKTKDRNAELRLLKEKLKSLGPLHQTT